MSPGKIKIFAFVIVIIISLTLSIVLFVRHFYEFKSIFKYEYSVVQNGCGKFAVETYWHTYKTYAGGNKDGKIDTFHYYVGIYPSGSSFYGEVSGGEWVSTAKDPHNNYPQEKLALDTFEFAKIGHEIIFATQKLAQDWIDRRIEAKKEAKRISDSIQLCHTYHRFTTNK